jgi:hypothetical protein
MKHTSAFKAQRHTARVERHAAKRKQTRKPYDSEIDMHLWAIQLLPKAPKSYSSRRAA